MSIGQGAAAWIMARIEAWSAGPGKGARFTLRLPGASSAAAVAPLRRAAGNGHALANKRILLADDNRDAAESLAIILRLEGHEVELAHDGAAALRATVAAAGVALANTRPTQF